MNLSLIVNTVAQTECDIQSTVDKENSDKFYLETPRLFKEK